MRRSRNSVGSKSIRRSTSIRGSVGRGVSDRFWTGLVQRRSSGFLWFFVLVCILVCVFVFRDAVGGAISGCDQQRLISLEVKSSGVLTPRFIKKFLGVQIGQRLLDVEIESLRTRLLSLSQVSGVSIEKVFPEKLVISLEEWIPVLKGSIARGFKHQNFLVSREGVLFQAHGYNSSVLDKLVALEGVGLRRINGLIAPIHGIDKIVRLVSTAQSEFPNLFKDWRTISCRKFDPSHKAVWSRIVVRLSGGQSIVFSNVDFHEQLSKLNFILQHTKNLDPVKRIDLSLTRSAAVKMK